MRPPTLLVLSPSSSLDFEVLPINFFMRSYSEHKHRFVGHLAYRQDYCMQSKEILVTSGNLLQTMLSEKVSHFLHSTHHCARLAQHDGVVSGLSFSGVCNQKNRGYEGEK